MSGLEALGAAASIIGVVGALKTCIDLLDIISTARGADLELEHLLVHLQWQRIRFYCWVQETGFTEAIIQDDERPAMQAWICWRLSRTIFAGDTFFPTSKGPWRT
ncbi:hypothetical protein QL093DRAFT_1001224 [Fusarium oxysporum]|nr:hypothetical protein QL093DRAFT_1001224 [Fusarium oxysporum]